MSLCIIRAGHTEAVSQIMAALVDSGGHSLACNTQNALLALDEKGVVETYSLLVRWGPITIFPSLLVPIIGNLFLGASYLPAHGKGKKN